MESDGLALKIRVDVDYAYPSRLKSFFFTFLGWNPHFSDYLRNCKIMARIINKSKVDVKVYWFFTYLTRPDSELLGLLNNSKHEIGLHLVKDGEKELPKLGCDIRFYTVHGIDNFLAKVLWKRRSQPLSSCVGELFGDVCYSLEHASFLYSAEKSVHDGVASGCPISLHPDWLFKVNIKRRKGGSFTAFKYLLSGKLQN